MGLVGVIVRYRVVDDQPARLHSPCEKSESRVRELVSDDDIGLKGAVKPSRLRK
jgi:hypothetical protein